MTLETFFEKFDLFADAPDAVAKMRELVLDLAVQGRLVHQDAADEDVELLLARNDEDRRTVAKRDRRADAENQPLLSADDRWEIAESWSWRALADLVLFVDYRGKTPAKLSDGIRLLTAKNVRKGEINLAPEEFLSEEEYHSWMTRGFPKAGDVLFTTEAPMGNAAVVNLTDRFALAQRVICFQSYGAVDSSFLVLQILSTQFQAILDKNGTGVTAKGIKASKLKQLPIALPPLAEQKRIVAKVDELMALCDRLEAQQQERETQASQLARASLARFADTPTPANLEYLFHSSFIIHPSSLRRSILTLAVQGKLVPQDPNDESAEAIVSRIRHELPEDIEASLDGAELPWALPWCWQWIRLGTIANIKHGYAFSSESFTSEPSPYVLTTPGNFYESGGFRDRGANTKYFKGDVPASFILNAGDLIIPMTEQAAGLLGSPAFIPADGKAYLHNQRLGKLEFYTVEVAPEFVFWFFNCEFFRGELARTCTGMKVRHTSPKRILKVPFALPPLAEQRRIVAKVEQLMALVDALETQLAASRATAANLLSALVAELTQPS
jgi:type I restriction enzyme, S subunit